MHEAYFIVKEGMVAGALGTCNGPFEDEAAALRVAQTLQPGSYRIYGPTKPGKGFSISAPIVTFDK